MTYNPTSLCVGRFSYVVDMAMVLTGDRGFYLELVFLYLRLQGGAGET